MTSDGSKNVLPKNSTPGRTLDLYLTRDQAHMKGLLKMLFHNVILHAQSYVSADEMSENIRKVWLDLYDFKEVLRGQQEKKL